MGKDALQIEWTLLEDERAWSTIKPTPETDQLARPKPHISGFALDELETADARSSSADRSELRLAALVVVLFLLLAGSWARYRQMMQATMAGDLQAIIAQEVSAPPVGDALNDQPGIEQRPTGQAAQPILHSGSSLHASNSGYQPDVQIDELHRIGKRAMANVTVSYLMPQGVELPYRETHFYRQTAEGWQRIEPDVELMGPWQTLETKHFIIRYRLVDARAVAEAAPRLDQMYEKLRLDLGPPIAVATQKISIEFSTDELPEGYRLSFIKRTLTLPSPVVLSVPAEMTAATVLYEPAVYPLARLAVLETVDQYSHDWKAVVVLWRSLIDALPLWALWDNAGPLAVQRGDVVRWLYQNALPSEPGTLKAVPDTYRGFCRSYRIWRQLPGVMSIPLTCTPADEDWQATALYPSMPIRFAELCCWLIEPDSMPSIYPEVEPVGGVVAMETLIEYVVATYGRESLPRLIAALGQHASWHSLIPAVFNVSADEFEAGWQSYLAHQYDTSPPQVIKLGPDNP